MYLHNDEILYDPLPQPYRFVNKILLRCIEDAIDLAEGDGSAESFNSIISTNLRLTKVGKIPTFEMNEFFLSTVIDENEVTQYALISDTQYLACGTSQGMILICDVETKSVVYSLNVASLSKFVQPRPITHLIALQTDHSNFVIAFATEDYGYLLFISPTFILRSSIDLDISQYNFDTLQLKQCSEPYIVITDGTGRTAVYSCFTPNEIVALENSTSNPAKQSATKPIQLDPVLEIEKCPISTGPVSSEAQLATKTEEPGNRKKPVKKKAPPPAKRNVRSKSPGTQAIENAAPAETTQYQATANVVGQNAVLRFGTFPILLMYKLQPSSQLVCEFPIPSPVTASLEIPDTQQIVYGFENGSFCFLNVPRKTLHDHQFPKQGAIKNIRYVDGMLITFTESKVVSVYKIENFKVVERLLVCCDDNILNTNITNGLILTYNQKLSDANISYALTNTSKWEDREIKTFPNCSMIQPEQGDYHGTIATPTNLELIKQLWNESWGVLIFNDPVEYKLENQQRNISPAHGKRGSNQKTGKSTSSARKGKANARATKKVDETKENDVDTPIIIKRQIIGVVNLNQVKESFETAHLLMEKEKTRRREMILASKTRTADSELGSLHTQEEEEEAPDEINHPEEELL